MKPLDNNSFEDEWRKAFEGASEMPPTSVWDEIEQALDKKPERKGIFLLWLNNNKMQAAAGVLLCFMFASLFYINSNSDQKTLAKTSELPQIKPNKTIASQEKNDALASAENNNNKAIENTKSDIKKSDLKNDILELNEFKIDNKIALNNPKKNNERYQNTITKNIDKKQFKENKFPIYQEVFSLGKDNQNGVLVAQKSSILDKPNQQNNSIETEVESLQKNKLDATILASKTLINLPPNRLNRKLILDYEFTEVAVVSDKQKNIFWLGLQSGVGSFNPSFSTSKLNSIAAADFVGPQSNPGVFEGGFPNIAEIKPVYTKPPSNVASASEGYRNGITFGLKIRKNWSLESGVAYVRGNSTIESNTYSIDRLSGEKNTYLADFLSNNSTSYDQKTARSTALTTIGADGQFNNLYEFVSIPLQAGFTFLAKKKLNFSLHGGASTDIFIGNKIGGNANLNVSSFSISNNDKIYKPFNISALGSARVNYRLKNNWSTYIGGQYQQGLGSMLLKSSDINLNLRQAGIQYGLNLKF